jgi:predicted transcriptional regulator
MERTQISLSREQVIRLRSLASRRHTSMAALIREAVDRVHPPDADEAPQARWARARAALGGGHSGTTDLGTAHDAYLGDAYEPHNSEPSAPQR